MKSAEELREIEHLLASPRQVSGEGVLVRLLLERRTYEQLLPPPLSPLGQPQASLIIGRWQSSFTGDAAGGLLHLRARHDGTEGNYPLSGWYDSEHAISFGREVLGEPLKLATSGLYRSGGHARGWIDRHGVRLIDLDVELGPEQVAAPERTMPEQRSSMGYNLRAHTAPGGSGLDGDAALTRTTYTTTVFARRTGTARVVLSGGPHDPLNELSIVDIVDASYVEFEQTSTTEIIDWVPAADFLPYHHGRNDSWPLLGSQSGPATGDRPDSWW